MGILDELFRRKPEDEFLPEYARPADPLRQLRDAIPENKDGGLSMLNMIRSALGTSANWLDGTKDPSLVGPQEMVSPFGLGVVGSMGTGVKNAMTKPSRDHSISEALGRQYPNEVAGGEMREVGRKIVVDDGKRQSWAEDPHLERAWNAAGGQLRTRQQGRQHTMEPANHNPDLPRTAPPPTAPPVYDHGVTIGDMKRTYIAGGPRIGVVSAEGAMTPFTRTDGAMRRPGEAASRAPTGLGRPQNDIFADNAKGSAPGTVVNSLADQPQGIRGVHYTTADFEKFDPKQFGGTGDAFGVGVYSTPMEWAHHQRAKSASGAYSYGDRFEDGARSIPTEHRLTSPFRIDMPDDVGAGSKADWSALRQNWLGPKWKHDMSPYEAAEAGLFKDRGEAAQAFNKALKAHGRDGVTVFDDGIMREVMAMEPGRVKSATTGATLFADQAKGSAPGLAANSTQQPKDARELSEPMLMELLRKLEEGA